jgi:hypothetical protein
MELIIISVIFISGFGVQNPAFNKRTSHIELIDAEKTLKLTHLRIEGSQK